MSSAHPDNVTFRPETGAGAQLASGCQSASGTLTVWQPIRVLSFPTFLLIAKAHTSCGPGVPAVTDQVNPCPTPAPGNAAPMSGLVASATTLPPHWPLT